LEKPGFYPIIGGVTLEDLISISGGLLPGADLENVTIREYGNNNGETSITGTQYIDISSIHPRRVVLDGHFTVYIPYLINNADVGSIEIDGEVSHPGTYTFSRNETLEEVLYRAGGFTETAYPLGVSFHRESLKSEQRLSNANLAREVEQSILFLSQSQLSGAGDQIKAVVAYANQLKNMPATGKQILNIEGTSRTMLLEDGDKLYIPRRPSHVTISGSVQNPVTTAYQTNKTLENYIAEAGGFKRIADKKNVFIMLPGGRNTTLSSLQKEGSFIPAGSVIVVPPKTDKLSALGLTDIWSRVLGNIATSILAINAATN
jgi:protein involved in polysaccharide export with SLBB domain